MEVSSVIQPMQNEMEIIGIEKVKDSPQKPELAVFHVSLLPVHLARGKVLGRDMLEEMLGRDGCERFSGLLESTYDDNQRVFRTVIPMTQHTLNMNGYHLGSHVLVTVHNTEKCLNDPSVDPVVSD